MKGKIEIVVDGKDIGIHVKMSKLVPSDRMIIVDAVVRALRIDTQERMIVGLTIAAGGLETVSGGKVDETIIDLSALKKTERKARQ